MRKTMVIPTYWSRESGQPWREGDAVYDHPTPIDQEGTLARTLKSMKQFSAKDFKLVILICPTAPEVEQPAYAKVRRIVEDAALGAETYLFTAGDLAEMARILREAGLGQEPAQLLSLYGYSNVRNACLLAASVLTADAAVLIDDDEVFEIPDYLPRSVEFLGHRVYGDVVYGVAGYYRNKNGSYYDDVLPEPWMTYWDRFGCKGRAFDKIIGKEPRLKRTPFAFGGAMTLHRELFECVPFDPLVKRGEDIDYLINSRMFGFNFFLDNTLWVKHLPAPRAHPQWMHMREDIYRFVYQRAKLNAQYERDNLVLVSAEDLDPYPGEFLKADLEDKVFRSSMMLCAHYLSLGEEEASQEALKNIYLCQKDAPPAFNAFEAYLKTQKQWETLIALARQQRYALRKVLERHNLSAPELQIGAQHRRQLSPAEITDALEKALAPLSLSREELSLVSGYCHVKTYLEQEVVFSAGDFNESVSILLKGEVHLMEKSVGAGGEVRRREVARLHAGDLLGESCLVHEVYRLEGVAGEFTELLCIGKTNLNTLLEQHPAIGIQLLKLFLSSLSSKITRANETTAEKK